MHLYELSTIFAQLQAEIEDADPETASTALAKIDILGDAFDDKAKEIGRIIKNMQAMADAVGSEAESMAMRKQAMDNRIASIKEYLRSNMARANVFKIDCPQFKISLVNNPPKIEIRNEKLIPQEYMVQPPTPTPYPDKKKIMADLKEGVVIEGVEMSQGNRVQIR